MKTIYLDLKQQKRTLTQNEFTILADSKEAKAFFTTKQPNQDLVIDLENKATYFEEYQMQEDGTRYAYYLPDMVDGVYIPDLEKINEAQLTRDKAELKQAKIEAKDTITVTTSQGNIFDGNAEARGNMSDAILASEILGTQRIDWKLANNDIVVIELSELKKAHALAIQEAGRITIATTIDEVRGTY